MYNILSRDHVIIQLSKAYKNGGKFVDMKAFVEAVTSDPDLSRIPYSHRLQALQTIYVGTGCDYIPFFSGVGKISFLSTIFQYANFIVSEENSQGGIGSPGIGNTTFLSFLRLVGSAYFR